MIKVIRIGEKVEVNNSFIGIIISISVRKKSVVYEVQKTTEDGISSIWANDWEITSDTEKLSIINQCVRSLI